jgi:hypothetical protein
VVPSGTSKLPPFCTQPETEKIFGPPFLVLLCLRNHSAPLRMIAGTEA